MKKLKMFGSSFSNDEIIKALNKQKEGEILPEDGHFAFMYDQMNGPSIPFMISAKKNVEFCYVDHEEFILLVKENDPRWIVEVDQNLVKLVMLYNINDSQLLINFVFDMMDEAHRNAVFFLEKTKEFRLNYIALLYGGLVLDSRVKFRIPDSVIKSLKNL